MEKAIQDCEKAAQLRIEKEKTMQEIQEKINVRRRVKEVVIEAAYWRKANQIHSWFVDNVQNGNDDCEFHAVTKKQLLKLGDTVQQVLSNPEKAMELLPPQSGFFFGSTEVDEYYWGDIEYTIKLLESVLNDEKLKEYDFEYYSSW